MLQERSSDVLDFDKRLTDSNELIEGMLTDPSDLPYEGREVIARYTAAVEGNFIPWMTAALISARSWRARHVVLENLEDELRENHQTMLRHFAEQASALPMDDHYRQVRPGVDRVRDNIMQMNGLYNVSLGAFLENVSCVFIPYLERIGIQRKVQDLTYTRAHGVADIKHARQLLEASVLEASQGYENPVKTFKTAAQDGTALLGYIFRPDLPVGKGGIVK